MLSMSVSRPATYLPCVCLPLDPECDAAVGRFAPQAKKECNPSVSSEASGPASHAGFMDQSTRPCVRGDGGSAGRAPRLESPMSRALTGHDSSRS